jgi:2-keto-4-pentenoate hydratase
MGVVMRRRRRLLLPLLACPAVLPALAAVAQPAPQPSRPTSTNCPSDEAVGQLARNMLENRPSPAFTGLTSLADGFCAQDKLVRILQSHWGRPVGYKLGLTSAPVQQRFGVNHPVRGVIFENTVRLRSGAEVPARFGAVPIVESDFLLRVRDDGINTAGRDHIAILRHLDQAIPYIELADLTLSGGFDGPNLLAINVGARLGVLGEPVPVEASEAFARRLAEMVVVMTDDRGQERARMPGTAVLGHPLNAVAFLIEDLARAGRRLEAGQLLSVAGFSPTLPVEPGRTYTVRYEGLAAQPVSVSVRTR